MNLNFVFYSLTFFTTRKKVIFVCRFSVEIVLYLMLDLDKVCRNLCGFSNFQDQYEFHNRFGIGLILKV